MKRHSKNKQNYNEKFMRFIKATLSRGLCVEEPLFNLLKKGGY